MGETSPSVSWRPTAPADIRGLLQSGLDRDTGGQTQRDQLQVHGDGVRALGAGFDRVPAQRQ
ncbi:MULTISPECIES: hypothetical protein, partial [unclassified Streptomyces]|uniref:hypothetical protein n=1 Tax=unclassified Streptomyces TaxID=2593676 RepID=UPI0033F7EA6B